MSQKAIWHGEQSKYSATDIRRIGEVMWSKAGPKIQAAADNYRVERMLRKEMPKAAQVNKELRRLSKSIRRVLEASEDLDDLTLDTVQIWANRLFKGTTPSDVMSWRNALSLLAYWLEDAADENSKPGPPRDEARRRFVYSLAEIWEEVNGEWPKKSWDSGPFYDFVKACDAPFNPAGQGLEGQIKAVISRGKNQPQKPPK